MPNLNRLPPHPAHKINRDLFVTFQFNGQVYRAFAGDTVASALWAAGVRQLGHSLKYHRPRGAFAFTPADSNSLIQVDNEPNVRATACPAEAGMVVKSQSGGSFAALRPRGFHYKSIAKSATLWPLYEIMLRNTAGLGQIPPDKSHTYYDKKELFTEVLIIGGGPAGLSAALQAARKGARVLLLEELPYLGGHLAHQVQPIITEMGELPAYALADQLAQQVLAEPNIQVELNATCFGIYENNQVGAVQQQTRLLKIQAKSVIIANGAWERPLLFPQNDLPGVLLGSAAQRLLHLYGVKPGQRAVVLSANDEGLQVALDLYAAGVKVVKVMELRENPNPDLVAQLAAQGLTVTTDRVIIKARGHDKLEGIIMAQRYRPFPHDPYSIELQAIAGSEEFVSCDVLVTSVGWTAATGLLAQAKATFRYDTARVEFLPDQLPPTIFTAGRVNGTHTLTAELLEGEIAGLEAAAVAGHGKKGTKTRRKKLETLKAAEPVRSSPFIYIGQGQQSFVSFDEEITMSDLRAAVAEGFHSMELLQRYCNLGLGPSQGKYEAAAIALTAQATQQPLSEMRLIASPSPFSPISLGVLAGRNTPLVRYTPMHAWHSQWRAKMMTEAGWRRPESYDNPVAEALTVRRSVGLMDVSSLGKLELRGADVPILLARLYGEHYAKLAVGRAGYGLRCNTAGVVLDDAVAAHVAADSWYLTTSPNREQAVYDSVISELQASGLAQVTVTNITDSYAAMHVVGPQARLMLQPLTEIDLSEAALPLMSARRGTVAGVSAIILRQGFMGELGYELHVLTDHALALWEKLMAVGVAHGIAPIGVAAQRLLRLERGHFILGHDTAEWPDPFAADMIWVVKLEQPNRAGQPSLVRWQAGRLTHKLVGFQMLNVNILPEEANLIVKPNLSLPTGFEIIGQVTSAAYSPNLNKSIGLCWLPIERSQVGAEFSVRVRGELHTGRVGLLREMKNETDI